jgi:hypothetical protein
MCITWIMHQQLWGYKVEGKLYLVLRKQNKLYTNSLDIIIHRDIATRIHKCHP